MCSQAAPRLSGLRALDMDDIELLRTRFALASGRAKAPSTAETVARLADGLGEAIQTLAARVDELEKAAVGAQKKLDFLDAHALIFAGAWLPESTYHPGAVVRHHGKAYTALRHISPGKGEPGRSGAGWTEIA